MRGFATGAIVLALLSAGGAQAASQFSRQPTGAELTAALSPALRAAGTEGRALMRCKPTADRRLTDCHVISESPSGVGLGAAMLALAPLHQLSPAGAAAIPPGGEVTVVHDWYEFDTPPDWRRKPSADDLLAVWPREAMARGLEGHAVINCIVTVQGALQDCVPISETPPDALFGAAAVALTPQFLMTPAKRKGAPVPSTVNIPINFALPPGSRGTASAGGVFGERKIVSAGGPWVAAPSYADVAAAYPARARAAQAGGHVALSCNVRRDGGLGSCTTLSEEPKGMGFADAAKILAQRFRADPALHAASVQLPVTFDPSMLSAAQPVIGRAKWISLPSDDQTSKVFASLDASHGPLTASLSCVVQPDGSLAACQTVSERPAGSGLAAAFLSLTSSFRMSTWTTEGLPTIGGRVRIPLRYEPEAAPTPAAAPGAR